MDANSGTLDVIHDETLEFEGVFRRFIDTTSIPGARVADIRVPNGNVYRAVLRNLRSFETRNSILDPALQAADVLAASVAKVARVARTPNSVWSHEMQRLAELTMPPLLMREEGVPFAAFSGHSSTFSAIVANLVKGLSRSS